MTATTISDTERREVARRLRELRGGWSSGECYYTIIHELDLPDTSREDGGHALYGTLADLIEPSEPKVKCVAEVKVDGERLEQLVHDAVAEVTGIDRDELLALAKVLHDMGNQYDAHKRYELGTTFRAIAARIREALGAQDA